MSKFDFGEMPDWVNTLIEKGGSVNEIISLMKEKSNIEREERLADREMQKAQMQADIRKQEIALRQLEIEKGATLNQGSDSAQGVRTQIKFPKFVEGQDPDIFLRSFEKLALLHKWDKSQWAVRLVPLLSGKALEAYSRVSDADSGNYDAIKLAILKRYELTAEAYREKFRGSKQLKDESFKDFVVRTEGYLKHWCIRENIGLDFEKLYDLFMREQLLMLASKDLRLWVNEHKPCTVDQVVELAESYQTAHTINMGQGQARFSNVQSFQNIPKG